MLKLVRIFVCLTLLGFAGTLHAAYIDNSNGTVTDTSTGLMWQQEISGSTMDWENAESYCESLNLAGHTDWRLPSIRELQTIEDYSISYPGPTIDITYFPHTPSSWFWTSTSFAGNASLAWVVNFYDGDNTFLFKRNDYYVRAVRGLLSE